MKQARDVSARVASLERPMIHERPSGTKTLAAAFVDTEIGYELVQGALVRWTDASPDSRPPPTAVLVHGILGSRRNMQSFAHRLVEAFPSWQVVLVDLRCHGESARLPARPDGPHSVEAAGGDVLRLLGRLKLFPEVLVGHSFGGKVVMSMAEQFGKRLGSRLPRPVKVWVLDTLPGEIRAGEPGRKDHPADLIAALRQLSLPVANRQLLMEYLEQRGFSRHIASWVGTNLVPMHGGQNGGGRAGQHSLVWSFDLDGIAAMYASYEATNLWRFLAEPQDGISVSFVRAERSAFRWGGGDESEIQRLGHRVSLLPKAGHWVHSDNPAGLLDIIAPSFGVSAVLR